MTDFNGTSSSVRERLKAMPKASISVTVDRGVATQGRLRLIMAVGAGLTVIGWAGYFTASGQQLAAAISLPPSYLLASFITGFVVSCAFAMLSAALSFSTRRQGANVGAIEDGHYLWCKQLDPLAAEVLRDTAAQAYAQKQKMMLKVLAGVSVVTAVLGSLGGIGEPDFGEYFVTVSLSVIVLFAAIGGFFWLVYWATRSTQFLMDGLDQVVFTEDGLLVEPIFWPWDSTGFRLEQITLLEAGEPQLDMRFVNQIKGQAQVHAVTVPLDKEDLAEVRALVQILGNYRSRSALKNELNQAETADIF